MKQKEEMYESILPERVERKGKLVVNKKTYEISYTHYPNYVRRSKFDGLPRSVGKTFAKIVTDGTAYEAEAECWVMEPFTFERGELVVTGRLLKSMGLPTVLAEKVKVE